MTPVNFISFLISLYLIDFHYQSKRADGHHQFGLQSRLPSWMHHLLFRPQPYQWVNNKPTSPEQSGGRYYYHSKQKKLIKMEATDAFELRNTVLLGLLILGGIATWMAWRVAFGVLGWFARSYL
jgi:hypothetical protein